MPLKRAERDHPQDHGPITCQNGAHFNHSHTHNRCHGNHSASQSAMTRGGHGRIKCHISLRKSAASHINNNKSDRKYYIACNAIVIYKVLFKKQTTKKQRQCYIVHAPKSNKLSLQGMFILYPKRTVSHKIVMQRHVRSLEGVGVKCVDEQSPPLMLL